MVLVRSESFGGFPLEYPFSVVAVDVGGTKIACAVVRYENADAAPVILSKRSISTDAQQGGEAVLARILDLADDVRGEALSCGESVVGVGVATAGRVDVNTGNIAFANEIMPGWLGQPLGDALRERFECPSAVLGDVQSHALGEARWGAARGAQTAVVMTPGTGLGGGIICHGKIVRGKHGFAGEIGSTMNTLDAGDGNLESVAAGLKRATMPHAAFIKLVPKSPIARSLAKISRVKPSRMRAALLAWPLLAGRISLIPISLWFPGPLRKLAPFGVTRWCRHSRSAFRAFLPICLLSMRRSAIMLRLLELRKTCWIL